MVHAEIEHKKACQIVHKWEKLMVLLNELSRAILSYFVHAQLLNWRKPENNGLLR